jgi:hypothetical protein
LRSTAADRNSGRSHERLAERKQEMTIELSSAERTLLRKILDSYLSELRQAIAATKRDTSPLHDEENLIKALQARLS